MKVLMTADTHGGVFTYALELCAALRKRDVEIVLAILGQPLTDDQRVQLAGLADITVHERRTTLEWMDDPWDDVRATSGWLTSLARRIQPDCLHLNQLTYDVHAWGGPVLLVAHSCIGTWWRAVHAAPAPTRYEKYRQAVSAGLRAADLVVAPTAAMLAGIEAEYGCLPRTRVIANGIETRDYGARVKQPVVFSAGRLWDEAKNARALQRVATGIDWPIKLAGDTDGPHGIARDWEPCRVLGSLSRSAVVQQLAHAAIYAHPARYEPFGLSVLEAAASGCALLLGRIPSLLENWDGVAEFVDPGDDLSIQRGLQRLIIDRAWRGRLGANAQRRALGFHSMFMADAYLSAYASARGIASARSMPCAS